MSSTLRPSGPRGALMSSRQISVPSSEALPPPANPPVCAIDMPILIGGCWALAGAISASPATVTAAPRSVLRFIVPPLLILLCSWFDCPRRILPLRAADNINGVTEDYDRGAPGHNTTLV